MLDTTISFITWDRLDSFKVRIAMFWVDATQMPICRNYYERVNRLTEKPNILSRGGLRDRSNVSIARPPCMSIRRVGCRLFPPSKRLPSAFVCGQGTEV
jgi:hypothetical protein